MDYYAWFLLLLLVLLEEEEGVVCCCCYCGCCGVGGGVRSAFGICSSTITLFQSEVEDMLRDSLDLDVAFCEVGAVFFGAVFALDLLEDGAACGGVV